MSPAREFIDFWIENSVHAAEGPGTEQNVSALTGRCVEMAPSLGFSKAALDQEVGDLAAYINAKLITASALGRDQHT